MPFWVVPSLKLLPHMIFNRPGGSPVALIFDWTMGAQVHTSRQWPLSGLLHCRPRKPDPGGLWTKPSEMSDFNYSKENSSSTCHTAVVLGHGQLVGKLRSSIQSPLRSRQSPLCSPGIWSRRSSCYAVAPLAFPFRTAVSESSHIVFLSRFLSSNCKRNTAP